MDFAASSALKSAAVIAAANDPASFLSPGPPAPRLALVAAPFVPALETTIADLVLDIPGVTLIYLGIGGPEFTQVYTTPPNGQLMMIAYGDSHSFGVFPETIVGTQIVYGLAWILGGGALLVATERIDPPLALARTDEFYSTAYPRLTFNDWFMF